jgi:hypothetical protein
MPFLDEIVSVLEAADVGRAYEDLFAGSAIKLPEGTATITTLRETAGYGHGGIRTQEVAGVTYEEPTAQLVVRARTLALAYAKARAAWDALVRVENQTVLGTWYLWILEEQMPFDMGSDTSGRTRYGFNFRACKRPS